MSLFEGILVVILLLLADYKVYKSVKMEWGGREWACWAPIIFMLISLVAVVELAAILFAFSL